MDFENMGRPFVHALLTDGDLPATFFFHTVSDVARKRLRLLTPDSPLIRRTTFLVDFNVPDSQPSTASKE